MEISIIGFGNFGKLAAKYFILSGFSVKVTDLFDKRQEAEELGVRFVNLEEACKTNIMILAVPMEKFEQTLHMIKDRLMKGTIVLDVCSLKIFACEAMSKILPNHVEIIGTHPLFGPQSCPNSIEGMKIALVKVRCKDETFNKLKEFCKKLRLKAIVTTSKEHDKQMAVSQALTHFIGQACKKINIDRVELSTKTFDDLMNIIDIIKNDTPSLFENMQIINPFAKSMRDKFIKSCDEINKSLNTNEKIKQDG